MRATKFIVPKFSNFVLKDTFLSLRTNDLGALFGDKVKIWGPQIDFGSPNRMYEKQVRNYLVKRLFELLLETSNQIEITTF